MANVTIPGISTAAASINDADLFEVSQGGQSKKVPASVLSTKFSGDTADDFGGSGKVTSQFGAPDTYFKDPLRASVEAASGGKATVMYDDLDQPSIMVRVPCFNLEDIDADLGTGRHPAFLVNSVAKSEIWVGRFQADLQNSRAVSWPGLDPHVSIDFDDAKAACENKGSGWHMMTNWEWAAVVWWVLKQVEDGVLGSQPRGNTDYGRAYDEYQETGARQDGATYKPGESSGNGRILTGSGPATWRHNLAFQGISDLVGNVWEWIDGMKIDGGRIYMPSDNYYTLAEASWPATDVYLENDAGTLRLSDTAGVTDAPINVEWDAVTMDAGYDALAAATRKLMIAALIAPRLTNAGAAPLTEQANGRLYANTSGSRAPLRGGSWALAGNAGVGALALDAEPSLVSSVVGFRPAFVA